MSLFSINQNRKNNSISYRSNRTSSRPRPVLEQLVWQGLFFFFIMLYLETTFSIMVWNGIGLGIVYAALFALPASVLLSLLTSIFPMRHNRRMAIGLTAFFCLLFSVQFIYHRIFGTLMVFSSIGSGGIKQAWEFRAVAFSAILHSILPLLVLFLPLIVTVFFRRRLYFPQKDRKSLLLLAVFSVALHFLCLILLLLGGQGIDTPYDTYHKNFSPDIAADKLGLLTAQRLDAKFLVLGPPDDTLDYSNPIDEQNQQETETPVDTEPTVDRSPNVLNIDFDSLIASSTDENVTAMHDYFKSAPATNKNEYTGMFKDYNLIFLCCEGFSQYVVDAERTPTLYKMASQGFRFTNFYNPIWGVSTSDGEYVNLTGLIPKSGTWTFRDTGKQGNDMYFTMGRQFERLGYETRAYHDHSYTYYGRDFSHPNMGYEYKGVGNGLEMEKIWPESDLEMMQKTIPEWINDEKFHTYYMTVSGHLEYNFGGNMQAYRNKAAVEGLPYSDTARAYLACNYELEEAMTYLVEQLETAGIADKTLIVMSSDHYPYGLIKNDTDYSVFDELAGHEVDRTFDLYRNQLIIWSASMKEPVTVDKYCSTLDLIPTLSNLLGLSYDSRLLMGTDVMSDTDPLVIFNNKNWISQDCMYNRKTKAITSLSGKEITQSYIDEKNKLVNLKFKLSTKIVDYDYYRLIDPAN